MRDAQKVRNAPPGYRWVTCMTVMHWRAKRLIYRKDGLPFRFLVRCR